MKLFYIFAHKYFKNSFTKVRIFFYLLILSPIFCTILNAQSTDLNFERILSDKGLSQNTIHYILQDKQGYMWFATEDGLDKYDGYNFTVYKNNPNNVNSIPDNFIWTLYEDKNGIMWIGSNSGGLSKFNIQTETFTNYKYRPNNPNGISNNNVRAILEDKKGNLWIGTEGGGLNKFNVKKNIFTHYLHDPKNSNSLSNNVVLSLYEDNSGILWIGTNEGIDKFNISKNEFSSYRSVQNDTHSLSNDVILSIYRGSQGILWVGTLNGLNRFDEKQNLFTRYLTGPQNSIDINNNRINSILEDEYNVIWVGTGSGLYQFDRKEKKFVNINQISTNPSNLSNNNVLSLYEDNSGLIWIGTAEDGVVKFDRERMKFLHYKHEPNNPNSLSHNTIRAIYQDSSGMLWIGTLGGGLNIYDKSRNKFIDYKHSSDNKFSISDNSVSAISKDKDGNFWVGTWGGGLNEVVNYSHKSYNNLKFKHFLHSSSNSNSVSDNVIQSIYQDSHGRIWIGTGYGLDLYDKQKNRFVNFINNPNDSNSISNNLVQSCIHDDKSGNLWVGTWDGLNKILINPNSSIENIKSNIKFVHYTNKPNDKFSLSDNRVISMYEDEQGNLWFGTYGGGLNELPLDQVNKSNSGNVRFIRYSINDGLTSNIIYGILGDDEGNLWLSTDNGLSKFNPDTKVFRNYFESDGLQSNQFFWGARFRGLNGELFFGGTNGVNAFYPSSLRDNKHVPPIVITSFQIFNKPVEAGVHGSPLTETISETKKIKLTYNQNVFSFEFAALDFTSPNKNQYAYMMKGFDDNWIYSGNRRFVTYTNLDPGTYEFKVKGSNNDGIWNEKGVSLTIIILPPFWKTWWFILLSILFGGGFIVLFISYRIKHLLDIERFRTKLAADLHDNIGSSLTEISILSEVISKKLESAAEDVKRSLRMISDNSRNLIDNMSDIVWLVNPKRDSLYDLILRLRDTYTELSSYASISFRSENIKSLEKVSLSMEHRQHLYLIFKEGINNCITHSGCTEISLDAFVKGKKLEMILKDNGKGFNLNEESSGNGLGNIKRRAEAIGGSVNITSNKGEGTTLIFVGNIL